MATFDSVLSITASVISIIAVVIGWKNSSEIRDMKNSNNKQVAKNGGVNIIGDHNDIGCDDDRR